MPRHSDRKSGTGQLKAFVLLNPPHSSSPFSGKERHCAIVKRHELKDDRLATEASVGNVPVKELA